MYDDPQTLDEYAIQPHGGVMTEGGARAFFLPYKDKSRGIYSTG